MRDYYRRGDDPERQFFRHRETSGNETFDKEIVSPWRKLRLREASFGNGKPYSNEEVEADLAYVREKEEHQFTGEREGEAATQMHYGTMEGIASYDWFGPDAEVVPTSRYDDIRNGVDFAVVFTEEDAEPVILAVDATTTEDTVTLGGKTERARADIAFGKLATIKYFNTPGKLDGQIPKPGEVSVPRVVIGANAENANELTKTFASALEKGGKRALGEHRIQHALLMEAEGQLHEQLADAIAALSKRFDVRHEPPKILEVFGAWERELPEDVETTGIPETAYEKLQHLLENDAERLSLVSESWAKNVQVLAKALMKVGAVRNEKGAGENPDTFTKDQTIQALKHSRRAA